MRIFRVILLTSIVLALFAEGIFIVKEANAQVPDPIITEVIARDCTPGSSCDGTTGLEVNGRGFTSDARIRLRADSTMIEGTYTGGDGSSKILTDFKGLISCQTYD